MLTSSLDVVGQTILLLVVLAIIRLGEQRARRRM